MYIYLLGLKYARLALDFIKRRCLIMSIPKDEIMSEVAEAWRIYLNSLETALDKLENDINEAAQMAGICTNEWCEATEHVIDELNNALFSISEPRWDDPEDSRRLKKLKRKVYDLYANYRGVYAAAHA
jgi:hypothetical protein